MPGEGLHPGAAAAAYGGRLGRLEVGHDPKQSGAVRFREERNDRHDSEKVMLDNARQ